MVQLVSRSVASCSRDFQQKSFDDGIIAAVDEQKGVSPLTEFSMRDFRGQTEVKGISAGEDTWWPEERSHFLKNMMIQILIHMNQQR